MATITKKRKMAETLLPEGNAHDDSVHAAATSARPQSLACVFSKRSSSDIPLHRSYLGSFPTIPRLKEHLYRAHRRPLHCPRCKAVFDIEDEFQQHLNAPERCIQAPSSRQVKGLTDEQVASLKRRPKESGSAEEMWKRIYEIVFPGTSPNEIPSPYCDIGTRSRHVDQLENYFRQRVIPATEQIMSEEFGRSLVPEMRSRLPWVVLSVVNTLCAEFRFHEGLGSSDRAAVLLQTSNTQGDAAQDTAEESGSVLPASIIVNPHNTEAQSQRPAAISPPVNVANERPNNNLPISPQPDEVGPLVSVPQPRENAGFEYGMMNIADDLGWDFSYDAGSFPRYHDSQQQWQ